MAARYRVEHETVYAYGSTVATSQHVAYLRPRELAHQRVPWSDVVVEPSPARISRRVDYFGNRVDQFTLLRSHQELRVSGRSLVEVAPAPFAGDPEASPPWEAARDGLVYRKESPAYEDAAQFAYGSAYVTRDPELLDFARPSFFPGRPLLASALDLMRRINAEFLFDPSATNLTTPTRRVLAERRGVCQDFAHLQISCLRSLGLSARYVSGYLLTDPPPGQHRLIGADASHAWLSVHCPRFGWVDLDPTNNVLPGDRYVTLAWGRDYGDVSPLRGVLLGGAESTLRVGVSVIPLTDSAWDQALRGTGAIAEGPEGA
jgi:transglutaminase-like putative cysteine protease